MQTTPSPSQPAPTAEAGATGRANAWTRATQAVFGQMAWTPPPWLAALPPAPGGVGPASAGFDGDEQPMTNVATGTAKGHKREVSAGNVSIGLPPKFDWVSHSTNRRSTNEAGAPRSHAQLATLRWVVRRARICHRSCEHRRRQRDGSGRRESVTRSDTARARTALRVGLGDGIFVPLWEFREFSCRPALIGAAPCRFGSKFFHLPWLADD